MKRVVLVLATASGSLADLARELVARGEVLGAIVADVPRREFSFPDVPRGLREIPLKPGALPAVSGTPTKEAPMATSTLKAKAREMREADYRAKRAAEALGLLERAVSNAREAGVDLSELPTTQLGRAKSALRQVLERDAAVCGFGPEEYTG